MALHSAPIRSAHALGFVNLGLYVAIGAFDFASPGLFAAVDSLSFADFGLNLAVDSLYINNPGHHGYVTYVDLFEV